MKPPKRWLLPPRPVRIVLGILLLAACACKAHALGTRPIVRAPKLWATRWAQTLLVEGELLLGLWLLSGLHPRRAWLVTLACFFAFFQVNFYLFLKGEKTCPCFGSAGVHPGQTALLDLAAVLALLVCKPFPDGQQPTIHSHPRRFRLLVGLFGLLGIPAVLVLGGRTDPTFLPDLRGDHALRERMAFQVNHPTNGELLALIQKNTGQVITADSGLAEERTTFGNARFQNISAASLMEQMLGKQSTRSYWVKTDDGYRLARAPLVIRWLPWLLAATLLGLVVTALLWQQRMARDCSRSEAESPQTAPPSNTVSLPRTGLVS